MKRTIGEVRKSSSVHCSQRSRSTVSAGVSRCRGVGVVIVLPTMQSAGCLVCAKRGERMVSEQEGATTSTHKTKVTVNFSRKFTTMLEQARGRSRNVTGSGSRNSRRLMTFKERKCRTHRIWPVSMHHSQSAPSTLAIFYRPHLQSPFSSSHITVNVCHIIRSLVGRYPPAHCDTGKGASRRSIASLS